MFDGMSTGELLLAVSGIAVAVTVFILTQFRSVRSRVWESEQRILAAIHGEGDGIKAEIQSNQRDTVDRLGKLKIGMALVRQKLKIGGDEHE